MPIQLYGPASALDGLGESFLCFLCRTGRCGDPGVIGGEYSGSPGVAWAHAGAGLLLLVVAPSEAAGVGAAGAVVVRAGDAVSERCHGVASPALGDGARKTRSASSRSGISSVAW